MKFLNTNILKSKWLVVLVVILLSSANSYTQNVERITIDGKSYYVYPFRLKVWPHSDYILGIDKKGIESIELEELDFNPVEIENGSISSYTFGMSDDRDFLSRKFKKALRKNPYPLLNQFYNLDQDLIPALDPIPDGEYVQLFEDFCLLDEKGICQNAQNVVAGKFTIKNNVLEGDAVWFNCAGEPLKYGRFKNGLKEGEWSLEVRHLNYGLTEEDVESYIENGSPEIDTAHFIVNYKSGVKNGKYKRFISSQFPVEEGEYKEGKPVGEWIQREVKVDVDEFGNHHRIRENSLVTSRFTYDNENEVVVKQPWIRDGLIHTYTASRSEFDFEPIYEVLPPFFDLFKFNFGQDLDLELENESFSSHSLDFQEDYFESGYDYDLRFSEYQAAIYDDQSETFIKRGELIDSVGMIAQYQGVLERYYPNGQLLFKYEFEEGKLKEEPVIYWDNGVAHDVILFVADSNHFERSIYDYNGKLFKRLIYDSLGDFSRVDYVFDGTRFIDIDGFSAEVGYPGTNFVFDNIDTLWWDLVGEVVLHREWNSIDTALVVDVTFNPITRVYLEEHFSVTGELIAKRECTFGEEYRNWNGTEYRKFGDLELKETSSASLMEWFEGDSIPHKHVQFMDNLFNISTQHKLFKGGGEYTGPVVINFNKRKLKMDKDELRIDFPDYTAFSKKKMLKKAEQYRSKGKHQDNVWLNGVDDVDLDSDAAEHVFYQFFLNLNKTQFFYPEPAEFMVDYDVDISLNKVSIVDRIEGFIKDGVPEGEWKAFDQFGAVIKEVSYQGGDLSGELKVYGFKYPIVEDEDNYFWADIMEGDSVPDKKVRFLWRSSEYKHGRRHGVSREYDWQGRLLSHEEYRDGQKHGNSIEYNRFAVTYSQFQDGFLDGYVQTYLFKEGGDSSLIYDLNFQSGMLQGESRTYHTNGALAKRSFFLNGEAIEDYESYDSLGFLFHYVKFKYTFPVEEKIWEENQLSVRYEYDWKDSIYFEPTDITTSESLERKMRTLGMDLGEFGGYFGRPSLIDKSEIDCRMTRYYPNDTVARDGELSGGKKVGLWKYYNYEGEHLYDIDYHDSIIEVNDSVRFKSKGVMYDYDSAGELLYKAYIIEKFEKYDCAHTDHYEIRQLFTFWESNDSIQRMNGFVQNFYDSGVLQSEGEVRDGLPTGFWKFYDPYGKLNQYGAYQLGKRSGRWLSGDLSKTKYLGDICLNPNLPDLEKEIKYRENLLNIIINNYKNGKLLNSQYFDLNMNRFLELEEGKEE